MAFECHYISRTLFVRMMVLKYSFSLIQFKSELDFIQSIFLQLIFTSDVQYYCSVTRNNYQVQYC